MPGWWQTAWLLFQEMANEMRYQRFCAYCAFLPLFLCLASVHAQPPLGAALDKILNVPPLQGGITGAILCRVSDGKVLYAHDANLRLLPASNRKLFTAAAALELLGDGYTIRTDLCADAKPDAAGVIAGNIYLRGAGDGLLSPEDLAAMAQALVKQGVHQVTGDVIGDGIRFADGPYGFGWEWDDFSDEEFPQISGLEINEGVLDVHVAPGAAIGDPVTATLEPPTDYIPVVVQARTGTKEAKNDCDVNRPWDKHSFLVTGTLPLGQTKDVKVPVDAPPLLAATLLRASLARAGISVNGAAITGSTPAGAFKLASHVSLPLAQYLAKMTKPSDNLLAESLIRLLDPRGTYDAGHARETPFFESLGVQTKSIALVDGCGVGRRNFVTARAVSQLLLGMRRKADWKIYYDSLPIMGVDGTLKNRLKGTKAAGNVHAKTGTLSQVRALSGYFAGKDGRLYVFSLLMNNFPGTARQAGDAQDNFVKYLVEIL